jgi:oxygen-independent coproporphyrinogen-3 oxidase
MQSTHAKELTLLGRRHEVSTVRIAVHRARAAGFNNLNLDLMYGLPKQTLKSWAESLEAAVSLSPDHLSLYALSVEPGTPLASQIENGQLPTPDPDLAADQYLLAGERLGAAGYLQYEISNWARPGRECRHNLAYWRNERYLGVGSGAWGHWPSGERSWRMRNVMHPQTYIERLTHHHLPQDAPERTPVSPAIGEWESIPPSVAMAETMFMGLRLVREGVSRGLFAARFGVDPVEFYAEPLAEHARTGLICWDDERVFLAPKAVLIGNQVFASFLPSEPN